MWISSLNMDGGVGKKMQEGGSGMGHRSCKKVVGWEKNARRWPSPEVITGSDWSSVSGTTSANSSTPHRTETSTKHKQVPTKQAQVTSLLVSTMEALVAAADVILLGYQLRSPKADKLFWELCQTVSGNWDRMLVSAMCFAGKSLALVDGNVWRQLEEGLRVARVY